MSRISFKQFISRQGKKDSRDGTFGGKGGLPSFSNTHPYFQGRLRIPNGDDDRGDDEDCGGLGQPPCEEECDPNYEYCNPYQMQGPNPGGYGSDPSWTLRDDWAEYWEWLACLQDPNCPTQPPTMTCSNPPCTEEEERTPQPDPPRPFNYHNVKPTLTGGPEGPEGPEETDALMGCDLSGKIEYPKDSPCWKAMMMTRKNMNTPKSNRHSLYYTGE